MKFRDAKNRIPMVKDQLGSLRRDGKRGRIVFRPEALRIPGLDGPGIGSGLDWIIPIEETDP